MVAREAAPSRDPRRRRGGRVASEALREEGALSCEVARHRESGRTPQTNVFTLQPWTLCPTRLPEAITAAIF